MPYIEVACRLLLATVFAIAVVGKVSSRRGRAEFVDSLDRMGAVT